MNVSSKKRTKTIFFSIGILFFLFVGMYVGLLLSENFIIEEEPEVSKGSWLEALPFTPAVGIEGEIIETVDPKELSTYILIKDSCGIHFQNECVRVRSGPGIEYSVVTRLRNNVVLKVSTSTVEGDGHTWYKIIFDDETLIYPERITGEWYVASEYADVFFGEATHTTEAGENASTTQYIIVDIGEQKLYAYDGDMLFMDAPVSTGLQLSPTPRGTFTVFRKMPSRYMQGPLPGYTDYYDLPGVPWNLYFTEQGAVIHGAYWHDSFGKKYSHGCVNLLPENARKLYDWAMLGTKIFVRD